MLHLLEDVVAQMSIVKDSNFVGNVSASKTERNFKKLEPSYDPQSLSRKKLLILFIRFLRILRSNHHGLSLKMFITDLY